MHRDEEATLDALKALDADVIEPCAARFAGRIVKRTGDGALIVFDSVVSGVSFAISVQTLLANRADTDATALVLRLRIGIHFADVIADDCDVFGDGVNVAARLEALAPPGGILMSRAVRDQIRDRIELNLEDKGELALKNIARPVRAFSVVIDEKAEKVVAATSIDSKLRRQSSWRWSLPLVSALTAVGLAMYWLPTMGPEIASAPTAVVADQPSIAVLPFADLSPTGDQKTFSAGVAGEILSTLSRSPYLRVISRNSSFSDELSGLAPNEIGRLLGARYLLDGAIQRDSATVRVRVDLLEASSGVTLWAETYDRPLDGTFALQDEIATVVAARLDDRIERAELMTASRKPLADMSAYDLFLQARSIMDSEYGKEATLVARTALERAVSLDPNWAAPHAWLAFTYYREIARGWSGARRTAALEKGEAEARLAVDLDPTLAFANLTMANLLVRSGDYQEALRWAEKAITLDPNAPDTYAAMSNILGFTNRAEEAIPLLRRAFDLDPLHPPLFDMYLGKSLALAGRFAEAVPPLKDCVRRVPDSWPCHQYLAMSYLKEGRRQQAEAEFAAMMENYPFHSIADLAARSGFLRGPQTDALFAALSDLGLPDTPLNAPAIPASGETSADR